MSVKVLATKGYGHIGHLPGSRLGVGDHKVNDGQARICTLKARDKHDEIIVQEKLEASKSVELANIAECGVCGRVVRKEADGMVWDFTPDFTCYTDPHPHECTDEQQTWAPERSQTPPSKPQQTATETATTATPAKPTGGLVPIERRRPGSVDY